MILFGLVSAANATGSSAAPLPGALKTLVDQGQLKVLRRFATAVPGLTGYVIRHDGRDGIVYGAHGALFIGQLISSSGNDLGARYAKRYLPKPKIAPVVKQLEKTGHLIVEGPTKAPVLYVFADPNCIYCHRLYQQTRALVAAGKLQLRWALVGFLKPSSSGRAAAILDANNPEQALQADEARFDISQEEGSVAPQAHPPAATRALLKAHLAAMRQAGGNGTPTLLYLDDSGHWAAKVGAPSKAWMKAYAQS
jgi:thiol:disulfide interchange protein DsbG